MDFWIGRELVHHSVTMVQILRAVGLIATIIAVLVQDSVRTPFRMGLGSPLAGLSGAELHLGRDFLRKTIDSTYGSIYAKNEQHWFSCTSAVHFSVVEFFFHKKSAAYE